MSILYLVSKDSPLFTFSFKSVNHYYHRIKN